MPKAHLKALQFKKNSPEGIWHSYRGDIAIVKSTNGKDFVGVSISYRNYKESQVVFTLTAEKQSEYSLISYPYYSNFNPTSGKASIRLNGNVIELHDDTRLVRKTNSETYDNALLFSYIPEFPNGSNIYPLAMQLSDSTFYLRITTFGDERGNKLTKKHWKEIISSPNLIIDIRHCKKQVKDAGHIEAYNHWDLMKGDEEAFGIWMNLNKEKWASFVEWFAENGMKIDESNKFYRMQYFRQKNDCQ